MQFKFFPVDKAIHSFVVAFIVPSAVFILDVIIIIGT